LNSSAPSRWDALADTLGGLSLPADFFPRADLYLDALAAANAEGNLVSFDPLRDGPAHVADSLQALRGLPGRIRTGIDVGTGGGFPGIPLALALPECRVVLLDGIRKKQAAVSGLAVAAGAGNVSALWGRAEELAREGEQRETHDVAFCRAVGRLPVVLELTLPFVRVGGLCLLHRGLEAPGELEAAITHLGDLGARSGGLIGYRLPGTDHDRFIVCIEKTDQIEDRYPRRPGIPAKRPLW
jgi:16S rRNA (guanine527-N7)-methyltransferase